MSYNRTAFLGAAGVAAAASAALAPALASAASVPQNNPTQGIPYAEFLARARAPFAHKQMFAATKPNGNVFVFMRNSLNGYQFGWGGGPGTLHAVGVFNGLGVVQGVGDRGWAKYRLADVLARTGNKLAVAATGNPWLHAPENLVADNGSQASPFNQDASIETLVRRRSEFFACDTAMITLSQAIVQAGMGGDPDEVHADLRGLLAPGVSLVPAGVSAMDALQAEHFTFYDANV